MTRRAASDPAYVRLLRSTRPGTPTFREFDRDLQGARSLETSARIAAAALRGFSSAGQSIRP